MANDMVLKYTNLKTNTEKLMDLSKMSYIKQKR